MAHHDLKIILEQILSTAREISGEDDVILSGDFAIEIDSRPVANISRGNHFGEMALLTQNPRSATVRSVSPGRVLKISSESFQEFIKAQPHDGAKMLAALARELSERLRQTNQFLSQRF